MNIRQLFRPGKRKERVGLAIDASSVALSVIIPDKEMRFKHINSVYRSLDGPGDAAKTLAKIVSENKLSGCETYWALATNQYKIHQIDLPEANTTEMLPAVMWAVKDLLDFPVAQAVIDYYPVPPECVRGAQQKINVVTSDRLVLQPIFDAIKNAGLSIKVIDIPELALRNIMLSMEDVKFGVGLLYQNPQGVVLGFYRDKHLLFSRVLTGVKMLQDTLDKTSGPAAREAILLEIQRTIDYYQSQLSQPPLKAIYIQPLIVPPGDLQSYLQKNLGISVENIDLNNSTLTLKAFTPPIQYGCFKSLSVAMREGGA